MASFYHTRSISLPSRPNQQILDLNENLRRVSSTESTTSSSSLSNKLGLLSDLYDSMEGFLQLPSTQQLLTQKNNRSCVEQLLNASLWFLDVCGTSKDVLSQTKEQSQELQSTLRRTRGDESALSKEAQKYVASRKLSKKAMSKSLKDLKTNCSSTSNSQSELTVLRQVEEVTIAVLESLLSFISGPRGSRLSLVSKLVHSKRVRCEEEESDINEFHRVDSALHSIKKHMNVQNELRKLEIGIQYIEEELESVLRRIIRIRAFLLNILTQ